MGQTTMPSAATALSAGGELSQQVRLDAGARLVCGEEVVAEGFDDVVESADHVGDAGRRDEHEEASQQAQGGADLTPVRGLPRRRAEVAAEELVGAVHQMDLHARTLRASRGAELAGLPALTTPSASGVL